MEQRACCWSTSLSLYLILTISLFISKIYLTYKAKSRGHGAKKDAMHFTYFTIYIYYLFYHSILIYLFSHLHPLLFSLCPLLYAKFAFLASFTKTSSISGELNCSFNSVGEPIASILPSTIIESLLQYSASSI